MPLSILFLLVGFLLLIALGVPIGFAMGMSAILSIWIGDIAPLLVLPGRMISSCESFVLLAIPFYVMAGIIMDMTGISHRLLRLAMALVGAFRGGLGMVVIIGEMFFSGISGSTVADVSAISAMALPPMKKAGYKPSYSVAIISAASAMGILIPPCINMIILGELMAVSVAALFFAGFLPATVLATMIMGFLYLQAKKYNLPAEERASLHEFFYALKGALIPLGLPVIMFGGILGGVFTPTEAGAIAVLYAFIVGVFVYRKITLQKMWHALLETGITTSVIMFLVAGASVLSYILAVEGLPELVITATLSISDSPWFFMVVSCLLFIFVGSILEGIPAMMIFIPLFLPVIETLGVNALHYGILVIASVGIGLFLPPAGVGLLVGCAVGNVTLEEVTPSLIPYLIVLMLGLGLLIFLPTITLFVPELLNLL